MLILIKMAKETKPENFENEIEKEGLSTVDEVLNLIKKLELPLEVGDDNTGSERRYKIFRVLSDGQLLKRRNQPISETRYLLLRNNNTNSFLVKFRE